MAQIIGGDREALGTLRAWDADAAPTVVRDHLRELQRVAGALASTDDGHHAECFGQHLGRGIADHGRGCAVCSAAGRIIGAVESRWAALRGVGESVTDAEADALHDLHILASRTRRKVGTDYSVWHAVLRGRMPAPRVAR